MNTKNRHLEGAGSSRNCLLQTELPTPDGTAYSRRNCLLQTELPTPDGTAYSRRNCLLQTQNGLTVPKRLTSLRPC